MPDVGQFAQMVLSLLNRPGNAVRGGLIDGPEGIGRGFSGEKQYDGTDLPGINQLPDSGPSLGPLHLTPRTIGGFAGSALLDPLTFVGGPALHAGGAALGLGKLGLDGLGAAGGFLGDAGGGLGRGAEALSVRPAGRELAEKVAQEQGGVTVGHSLPEDHFGEGTVYNQGSAESPVDLSGMPLNMQDWLGQPGATRDDMRTAQQMLQHVKEQGLSIDETKPVMSSGDRPLAERLTGQNAEDWSDLHDNGIPDQTQNKKVDMISPDARGMAPQPPNDAMPARGDAQFGTPYVDIAGNRPTGTVSSDRPTITGSTADTKQVRGDWSLGDQTKETPNQTEFPIVQTRPGGPEGQALPDNQVTPKGSQPLAKDQDRLAALNEEIRGLQSHADAADEWKKYNSPGDVLGEGSDHPMDYAAVDAWHQQVLSTLAEKKIELKGGSGDEGRIAGAERQTNYAEGRRVTTPADIKDAQYTKVLNNINKPGDDLLNDPRQARHIVYKPDGSVDQEKTAANLAIEMPRWKNGQQFVQETTRKAQTDNAEMVKQNRMPYSRWRDSLDPNSEDSWADTHAPSLGDTGGATPSTLTEAQGQQGLQGWRKNDTGDIVPTPLEAGDRMSFRDLVAKKSGMNEPGVDERPAGWHPGYLNNPQGATLDQIQREDLLRRNEDIAGMQAREDRIPPGTDVVHQPGGKENSLGTSHGGSVDSRIERAIDPQHEFDRNSQNDNIRDYITPDAATRVSHLALNDWQRYVQKYIKRG